MYIYSCVCRASVSERWALMGNSVNKENARCTCLPRLILFSRSVDLHRVSPVKRGFLANVHTLEHLYSRPRVRK